MAASSAQRRKSPRSVSKISHAQPLSGSALSWGVPGSWATSPVKCRTAERPGGQLSGPPKISKSLLTSWTGFRKPELRRYGWGRGLNTWNG